MQSFTLILMTKLPAMIQFEPKLKNEQVLES